MSTTKDKKLYYECPEKSFEDKVKREMAMPAWERPSILRDFLHPISFNPFEEHVAGMRMIIMPL